MGFKRFLILIEGSSLFFVAIYMGFKLCHCRNVVFHMGFKWFWAVFVLASSFFVAIYMGFKALPIFLLDSTVLGEHDLQKHFVK